MAEKGRWITVKGRRVFLEDDETPTQAIERSKKKSVADNIADVAQELGKLRKQRFDTTDMSKYKKLSKKIEELEKRESELFEKWRTVNPEKKKKSSRKKSSYISNIDVDQSILDDIDW